MQTLLCDSCAEYAQEISAADLSNLIWSKSGLQHCTDGFVVEASCLICPCFIRAFTVPRMLLAGARAGLSKLGIRTDAHVIDPGDIAERAFSHAALRYGGTATRDYA